MLIVNIVYGLAINGWKLLVGCEMSKKRTDIDALFFEQCAPDPSAMVFCVTFNYTDRIRILGARPEIIEHFRGIAMSGWRYGIQNECNHYGAFEV